MLCANQLRNKNGKRNDKIMPAHKMKRRLLTNEEGERRARENEEEEGQEFENENLVHFIVYCIPYSIIIIIQA